MPSFCKVAVVLGLLAPAFAAGAIEPRKQDYEIKPVHQTSFFPHEQEGRLGHHPINGHKHANHHHSLEHRIKKMERELESLRQTVFDMEHFFASFSHVVSVEGHKHGPTIITTNMVTSMLSCTTMSMKRRTNLITSTNINTAMQIAIS
ncbi:hypothetical protein DACRYDRAFT_99808 [Dacryopinax primogenitus]|uniref:Uncharacterized protein n=1 Tax=Dacryopinax primogenitus (strain DJM 731) TaxID=1858805 RepID=M5G3Q1_DACPD|nr:uncharacterized protein DACRYDRAFT_99808 [Dacryopinax primogenitus]EJU02845.1 hypothetical protein DACRYDRAFT_99808 [Dacryopinax primogenitus]